MASNGSNLLGRLLDPVAKCLTRESARELVALRADRKAQRRIDELAEAAGEGRLSPQERAEYEAYVAASSFIAILQSKARAILAGSESR